MCGCEWWINVLDAHFTVEQLLGFFVSTSYFIAPLRAYSLFFKFGSVFISWRPYVDTSDEFALKLNFKIYVNKNNSWMCFKEEIGVSDRDTI